jgi:hypothetical protein
MWQITYMLGFLPEWLWTALFFVGVALLIAAQFLRALPSIAAYRYPIVMVGGFSLMLSIWQLGAASNEAKWQERIKEVQAQLDAAKAESAAINDKLKAEQAEKAKIAEQKSRTVVQYVDKFRDREVLKTVEGPERVKIEKVIEYVEKCPVPKELLDAHNAAAKREGMK